MTPALPAVPHQRIAAEIFGHHRVAGPQRRRRRAADARVQPRTGMWSARGSATGGGKLGVL